MSKTTTVTREQIAFHPARIFGGRCCYGYHDVTRSLPDALSGQYAWNYWLAALYGLGDSLTVRQKEEAKTA